MASSCGVVASIEHFVPEEGTTLTRQACRLGAREERQLHAVGRFDTCVAVAPRCEDGFRDLLGSGLDETAGRLLAVAHLERQAHRSRDASPGFDRVDSGRLRLIEHFERGAPC